MANKIIFVLVLLFLFICYGSITDVKRENSETDNIQLKISINDVEKNDNTTDLIFLTIWFSLGLIGSGIFIVMCLRDENEDLTVKMLLCILWVSSLGLIVFLFMLYDIFKKRFHNFLDIVIVKLKKDKRESIDLLDE